MVEDKSLRAYKAGQRSKERKSHRHKSREIHLVPDLMVAGGAVYPLFLTGSPSESAISYATTPGASIGERTSGFLQGMINGYTSENAVIPAAELVIGGLALKWIGKKTGLNRIGTKGVKIL